MTVFNVQVRRRRHGGGETSVSQLARTGPSSQSSSWAPHAAANTLHTERQRISQARWYLHTIPAPRGAEAGGTQPETSLGNGPRPRFQVSKGAGTQLSGSALASVSQHCGQS